MFVDGGTDELQPPSSDANSPEHAPESGIPSQASAPSRLGTQRDAHEAERLRDDVDDAEAGLPKGRLHRVLGLELKPEVTPEKAEQIADGRVPRTRNMSRSIGSALGSRTATASQAKLNPFFTQSGDAQLSLSPRLRADGEMGKKEVLSTQLEHHFFLCHASSGRYMAEAIRRTLSGEGFKVVRDGYRETVDVTMSAVVVLLLTKGVLRDEQCRDELLWALDMAKEIICIKDETTDQEDPFFFELDAEVANVSDEIKHVVSEQIDGKKVLTHHMREDLQAKMVDQLKHLGRPKFRGASQTPTPGVRSARVRAGRRGQELPDGKRHHFFLCHHQSSGGDQCQNLCHLLTARGYEVWYDNDRSSVDRDLRGMKQGVRDSVCLLVFLSGRKEKDGQAHQDGEYEGPMTRWFCHEEMNEAHKAGLSFVGVKEEDSRLNKPDFNLEKSRARTAGKPKGQPVSTHVEQNLRLLDEMCFLPFHRQKHLVNAMLTEIVDAAVHRPPRTCQCGECTDPTPDDEPPAVRFRSQLIAEPEPEVDVEPQPQPARSGSGIIITFPESTDFLSPRPGTPAFMASPSSKSMLATISAGEPKSNFDTEYEKVKALYDASDYDGALRDFTYLKRYVKGLDAEFHRANAHRIGNVDAYIKEIEKRLGASPRKKRCGSGFACCASPQ